MQGHDIVVIGASAGGIEALIEITSNLPKDFPAALFVVVHLPSYGPSVLPEILSRAGKLPAAHPQHGDEIVPGRIYIAPPDKHLLLKNGHIHIAHGPRENRQRPAVDPLFRTAAISFGPRVVGVVLSGNLDDGTAGLRAIKSLGGTAIVQDLETAVYHGMPQSAIENVDVDFVLPVKDIAAKLVVLANTPVKEQPRPVSSELKQEADMSELDHELLNPDRPGNPSGFGCPECGGVLFELEDGEYFRFRCRVGHAYSPEVLMAEQNDSLDEAFWVALRALEENAVLSRRLADRARQRGHTGTLLRFEQRAEEAEQHAEMVRRLIIAQNSEGRAAD
jgi:two-component system, chemotaxis family, protein-glutamate methylesterase/glutaminase